MSLRAPDPASRVNWERNLGTHAPKGQLIKAQGQRSATLGTEIVSDEERGDNPNDCHPHLTSPSRGRKKEEASPSRGRNSFLPSHFGRGRGREFWKEPPEHGFAECLLSFSHPIRGNWSSWPCVALKAFSRIVQAYCYREIGFPMKLGFLDTVILVLYLSAVAIIGFWVGTARETDFARLLPSWLEAPLVRSGAVHGGEQHQH